MKLRFHLLCRTAMTFSAVVICLTMVSQAQTNVSSNAPGASPAKPEATPAETQIPQSVFVVPTSLREGRDPFFPRSTRPYGAVVTNTKTNEKPAAVVELVLKGISGTRERPLAIINTTTFGTGDENDVIAGTRRVRIRCVEINAEAGTVIIQIGNERRELRLKQPK